jgi:hypothetical protein
MRLLQFKAQWYSYGKLPITVSEALISFMKLQDRIRIFTTNTFNVFANQD